MQKSLWLQTFVDVYSRLGTDNLDELKPLYHPDITFIDPLHRTQGVDALLSSFMRSYSNIIYCQFVIDSVFESGEEAAVYWTMTFQHKQLNKREPINVVGHSHLKSEQGLVTYHRDYLDVGAMIYEHIPVLGIAVKGIKKRAVRS